MRLSLFAAVPVAVALAVAGCGDGEDGASAAVGFRTAPIMRTDIVSTVEATGTVTPRNSPSGIPVGAQVNGRIVKLFVDYNSTVTNGQIVAMIDPQVYEATYKGSLAKLHVNQANVDVRVAALKSAEAALALAKKTYERKHSLVAENLASVADFDSANEAFVRAQADYDSASASLRSARASVEQSEAEVSQAKANLEYCTIVSPVNGIVIDRKVEEGETVVSSMNAVPVLTIAEDLKTIWVEATVPEADIGNVKVGQTVVFTADAYRRRFRGKVLQVRRAATTTNNVVTFPVIIEAENPDEMLFPGMTVTLSIETARAENVVAVAAAAFRFRPSEADRSRLGELPSGRKLWFAKGDGGLEYALVKEGVSNNSFIEVVDGAALEGRDAIVGYQTVRSAQHEEGSNPFMPKMPKRGSNKGTAPEPKKK